MPTWKVALDEAGKRLDNVIASHLGVSVREAKRLIADKLVRVDGTLAKKGDHARLDATIRVQAEVRAGEKSFDHVPAPNPTLLLDVVYEDDAILAVNKPPGISSHPLREHERNTVVNAIVARCPACAEASEDAREGGLVHRLDRSTSGVLIAAKQRAAWTALRETFTRHDADKIYWALVEGTVDQPLALDEALVTVRDHARVAKAGEEGLDARTRVRALVRGKRYTLVEALTNTGRLHQVRVHLANAGHPLVGDKLYGAKSIEGVPDEALLHARAVSLPHPVDDWLLTISAPMPAARRAIVERVLGEKLPS